MALEDIKKGAENPTIPFIGQEKLSVALVFSLVAGLGLLAFLRPIAENGADWLNGVIMSVTNVNPATGDTAANMPAFGGEA